MPVDEKAFGSLAEVGVRVGVNLQQGQKLVIAVGSLEAADLVRAVVAKAYGAGARDVLVLWSDERSSRLKLETASDEALAYYPPFMAEGLEGYAREGAAFMFIGGSSPDLFAGIDPGRVQTMVRAVQSAQKNLGMMRLSGEVPWTIIAAPVPGWAKKVFPDETGEAAVLRLWEAVAKASRVDGADPVTGWQEHVGALGRRSRLLNGARLTKLSYRGPGTDLSIGLPETHLWVAADQVSGRGNTFVANIPTEEIFTLPKRDGVNGTVTATKPLSYAGVLIENLRLTFQDGRIVDFDATAGKESLAQLIGTDEGSHYLGEVSLVPVNSPISELGILFYNTLFDENAACHLAIGQAVGFTLKDGRQLVTEADFLARGANFSATHVDFMMGSKEIDIDGLTAAGTEVPIFRQGRWAGIFA